MFPESRADSQTSLQQDLTYISGQTDSADPADAVLENLKILPQMKSP